MSARGNEVAARVQPRDCPLIFVFSPLTRRLTSHPQLKVFGAIVQAVAVDVMNVLKAGQRPAKLLLHNVTVFQHVLGAPTLIPNRNATVALANVAALVLPARISRRTLHAAIHFLSLPVRWPFKQQATHLALTARCSATCIHGEPAAPPRAVIPSRRSGWLDMKRRSAVTACFFNDRRADRSALRGAETGLRRPEKRRSTYTARVLRFSRRFALCHECFLVGARDVGV